MPVPPLITARFVASCAKCGAHTSLPYKSLESTRLLNSNSYTRVASRPRRLQRSRMYR